MPRPSRLRWAVLAAYVAVVGVSQLLWLNFAPILTRIQTRYGVGELAASALVLVFPLLYVVLSLLGGVLSPVAKDIVVALQQVRQRV